MPELQVREYEPLLDSSDVTPEVWLKIAEDIARFHEEFDGFVVLHGTDTMAYTTSALAFMLQGLRKPVVFTALSFRWAKSATTPAKIWRRP